MPSTESQDNQNLPEEPATRGSSFKQSAEDQKASQARIQEHAQDLKSKATQKANLFKKKSEKASRSTTQTIFDAIGGNMNAVKNLLLYFIWWILIIGAFIVFVLSILFIILLIFVIIWGTIVDKCGESNEDDSTIKKTLWGFCAAYALFTGAFDLMYKALKAAIGKAEHIQSTMSHIAINLNNISIMPDSAIQLAHNIAIMGNNTGNTLIENSSHIISVIGKFIHLG